MGSQRLHRKSRAYAPEGFFECEAKGLLWLKEAEKAGGTRIVGVDSWAGDHLDIERIEPAYPTIDAAYRFGRSLAHMHDSGASAFGVGPADYQGTCYFGPLQDPVPMDVGDWPDPISYLAEGRLLPMVRLGMERRALTKNDLAMTEDLIAALPELLGPAAQDKPARLHGDLWSGNVMWTTVAADGSRLGQPEAVLIDPAAHGGHREEDLAMLALFGISYLGDILDGYQSVHPLKSGYDQRVTIWQLYPIAGHCVFFGGGYVSQYRAMCRSLLG